MITGNIKKTNTRDVREVSWDEKKFAMRRATVGFDKLSEFFAESYKSLYTALGNSGITPAGVPYAIYFSVDTQKKETDIAAAVAVPASSEMPPDCAAITIPRSRALLVTYYGAYDRMTEAYQALDSYLETHQMRKRWVLEEYFSDPAVEPDPANWKTNIYYLVD